MVLHVLAGNFHCIRYATVFDIILSVLQCVFSSSKQSDINILWSRYLHSARVRKPVTYFALYAPGATPYPAVRRVKGPVRDAGTLHHCSTVNAYGRKYFCRDSVGTIGHSV